MGSQAGVLVQYISDTFIFALNEKATLRSIHFLLSLDGRKGGQASSEDLLPPGERESSQYPFLFRNVSRSVTNLCERAQLTPTLNKELVSSILSHNRNIR